MQELENELFADEGDKYAQHIKEKTDRKLIISNFLESKDQSKVSKLGGQTLAGSSEDESPAESVFVRGIKENFQKVVFPGMITMLCGTFTYPVAVRVARKIFRLRGFYAIHISIAPFLALIHVNIFATCHALFRAKCME